MAANDTPVLIVGAGPTGMMLSLWLARFGVDHRIVDAASSSGTTSRALVLHARILEFYRQLGLSDALLARGCKVKTVVPHHNGIPCGVLNTSSAGNDLSYFPFVFSITQDEQEAIQEKALAERGVIVERSTELVDMEQTANGVTVTLRSHGAEQQVTARYVVGCDGAHSAVRRKAGIVMAGGTYDRAFFVADVIHRGTPSTQGQMNMCLSNEDFCMVIPMPHETGRARLIGFVPPDVEATRPNQVTYDDVAPAIMRNAPNFGVEKVNWFARYKVHHRVATQFHQDRIFLCGDAAHIHSPVGGQGMNTGLGDATNLAWKLASVIRGQAPPQLLETYSLERKPFAHLLVNTTDAMFTRLTSNSLLGRFIRNFFLPYILPRLIIWLGLAPMIFKRVSQILLAYPDSLLSTNCSVSGSKVAARAGDRLPWTEYTCEDGSRRDNFALLDAADWQVHVYGTPPTWLSKHLEACMLPLHKLPWNTTMSQKGLRENVLYLLRPDGHIGLIQALADTGEAEDTTDLDAYLQRWGIGKAQIA